MKFLFTLLPVWLLACVACAVNSMEQEFLCPICGTHWEQRIETSGQSRGLRLDLRQLGDVKDPPTLPQCTKCRFPLFSDQLAAQANDPAKAPAFKRLRSFVLGADFQMLASKNPSYFTLAQVQEFLGAPHRHIALSYLRASWQVEDRDAACKRLLEKARAYYVAALSGTAADDPRRGDLVLLCGEVERRLGKWDDAEKRFRGIAASGLFTGTPQAGIPALQLRLIERRDSGPHPIEGAEVVQNNPPPEREIRLENPGRISMASGRAEKPEGMKLEPSPKPVEEVLPMVFTEVPAPRAKPDPALAAKLEDVEKPALPVNAPVAPPLEAIPLPLPALTLDAPSIGKIADVLALGFPSDAAAGLLPAAPLPPLGPAVRPDPAPVEKAEAPTKPTHAPKGRKKSPAKATPEPLPPVHMGPVPPETPDVITKSIWPPKNPMELAVAVPPPALVLLVPIVLPLPLQPAQPESNFSDNPD